MKARQPKHYVYLIELDYPVGFPEGDFLETPDLVFLSHTTSYEKAENRAREMASEIFDHKVPEESWVFLSGGLVRRCHECGGLKKTISPSGTGAVGEVLSWV